MMIYHKKLLNQDIIHKTKQATQILKKIIQNQLKSKLEMVKQLLDLLNKRQLIFK